MKFSEKVPPREFFVSNGTIMLKDCGSITLHSDEQVTFKTSSGSEYDVAKKSWGFYATPSTNKRLIDHGFHTRLIKASDNKFHIALIEHGHEKDFENYISESGYKIIMNLDQL